MYGLKQVEMYTYTQLSPAARAMPAFDFGKWFAAQPADCVSHMVIGMNFNLEFDSGLIISDSKKLIINISDTNNIRERPLPEGKMAKELTYIRNQLGGEECAKYDVKHEVGDDRGVSAYYLTDKRIELLPPKDPNELLPSIMYVFGRRGDRPFAYKVNSIQMDPAHLSMVGAIITIADVTHPCIVAVDKTLTKYLGRLATIHIIVPSISKRIVFYLSDGWSALMFGVLQPVSCGELIFIRHEFGCFILHLGNIYKVLSPFLEFVQSEGHNYAKEITHEIVEPEQNRGADSDSDDEVYSTREQTIALVKLPCKIKNPEIDLVQQIDGTSQHISGLHVYTSHSVIDHLSTKMLEMRMGLGTKTGISGEMVWYIGEHEEKLMRGDLINNHIALRDCVKSYDDFISKQVINILDRVIFPRNFTGIAAKYLPRII